MSVRTAPAAVEPAPATPVRRCTESGGPARRTTLDDATDHRRRRTRPGHRRDPDPAVRRLPALGHRHLRVPGAGPAPGPVPRGAGQGEGQASPPRPTTRPPPPRPGPRSRRRSATPVGIMQIPKIGLERAIVQGIGVPDLRKGPGHYPATPLPGQLGNAAIAGHRTTYGAPFNRLDELALGDPIDITTLRGHFHYTMTQQLIVEPEASVDVAQPDPERDAHAHHLQPEVLGVAAPRREGRARPGRRARSLRSPRRYRSRAARHWTTRSRARASRSSRPSGSGSSCCLVGALWWLIFHRYHRWTTWFMGVIPFLVVLFALLLPPRAPAARELFDARDRARPRASRRATSAARTARDDCSGPGCARGSGSTVTVPVSAGPYCGSLGRTDRS